MFPELLDVFALNDMYEAVIHENFLTSQLYIQFPVHHLYAVISQGYGALFKQDNALRFVSCTAVTSTPCGYLGNEVTALGCSMCLKGEEKKTAVTEIYHQRELLSC